MAKYRARYANRDKISVKDPRNKNRIAINAAAFPLKMQARHFVITAFALIAPAARATVEFPRLGIDVKDQYFRTDSKLR